MPYGLKLTGITEAKKNLNDIKGIIKDFIVEAADGSVSITVPGVPISLDVTKNEISGLLENLPRLLKVAHRKAMKQMAFLLEEALNTAMESPVWDWTNDTRDIVDTGKLKDSLKIIVDSDGDMNIIYGTEYAAIVHYGGYFHPFGNREINQYFPGRPWVSAVLEGGGPVEQFEFEDTYKTLLFSELAMLI
jgi:phage gpG-like protein